MSPLLMTGLVSSLTRQLSHLSRFAVSYVSPVSSVYRCMSVATALRTRTARSPAFESHRLNLKPLLVQCQQLLCVQPIAGMKTRSALKRRCKDCFFVRRRGRMFVFCKTHPRHKQRQGTAIILTTFAWSCIQAYTTPQGGNTFISFSLGKSFELA